MHQVVLMYVCVEGGGGVFTPHSVFSLPAKYENKSPSGRGEVAFLKKCNSWRRRVEVCAGHGQDWGWVGGRQAWGGHHKSAGTPEGKAEQQGFPSETPCESLDVSRYDPPHRLASFSLKLMISTKVHVRMQIYGGKEHKKTLQRTNSWRADSANQGSEGFDCTRTHWGGQFPACSLRRGFMLWFPLCVHDSFLRSCLCSDHHHHHQQQQP